MSESSEITGPLITMIRQMGIFAERMNSGVIKSGKRYIHLHTPGTADILVCLRGRMIWLETKTEKGRTNPEQIENQAEFKRKVTELGHEYYRITSIDQGLAVLNRSV